MKYPFVLFYRLEKYSSIDNFFINNGDKLDCSVFITNNTKELNKLYNSNYQILVTFGPDKSEYDNIFANLISERMKNQWIHLTEITDPQLFTQNVNGTFIFNCTRNREQLRPTFSIFSTTYNSYDKIIRAYDSVKKQIFNDWEWVIIDDSPDDKHFDFLKKLMISDNRIRLYKRSENSGNIGNVKNESISLCKGKYVIELDHDDEILPSTLQDSVDLFESDKDVGFIYMDFINIYENGKNFWYGDDLCKGYGGYYCQKYNDKWAFVYITPNINNITLSHLACCPNHPRIWRKDVLLKMGSYCEFLPICDDYEILLRTALNTKMAKIHKLGYVQYMNESNNNFSLIRNSEINRIGPHYIMPIFYNQFDVNKKMKELEAYEDETYIRHHSSIWKRDTTSYEHKYCNLLTNPDYDCQYCIIGIDSLIKNLELILKLYENPRNDFLILDNKSANKYLLEKLDSYNLVRMKCYTLCDYSDELMINYFKLLYKSIDNFEIISNNIKKPLYNCDCNNVFGVINNNTDKTNQYLEIGTGYGETFSKVHFTNKIGVEPDKKTNNLQNIVSKTSDDYFKDIKDIKDIKDVTTNFDTIFIDGMHQSEYILNDVNNSMNVLSDNGKIFIGNILPLTYDEQLKIPNKHHYENGILKYGEPWTGDVWKVIFYLLQHHNSDITFSYFYNINYRGLIMIQITNQFTIDEQSINEINGYEYFSHFEKYVELLELNKQQQQEQ
jgi:glycosyltransferase involved in cell wall biosynthesis